MRYFRGSGLLAIVALSACTAPAPEPIRPEPVYNKYGRAVGASCPSGTTVATGSNGEDICVPPGDGGCTDPGAQSSNSSLPCPPYGGDGRDQSGKARPGGQQGAGNKAP